jgi:GT2 family glycosyltransferase
LSQDPNRFYPPPLDADAVRPLWTVLIPTWNCARFLEESLRGVLAQDPGEERMQIVVVDDHSTDDDPEAVVRKLGGSRVEFIRQAENVGKVRNYESGIAASRGRLIHQLHGDDRVKSGFYAEMERAFEKNPGAGAFFCECMYIDQSGRETGRTGEELPATGLIDGWLDKIVVSQRVQTPAMVVRRDVYEALGAFDRRLNSHEDWEMWIRIATKYPVGFLNAALAEYRTSDSNATMRTLMDGSHVRTLRLVLRIVDAYLPKDVVARNRAARNTALADYLTQLIPILMARGMRGPALKLSLDAISFSATPRTASRLLYFSRRPEKLVR